ncbi:MAG: LysR family transcriptional regulator [Salinisphaera sp.]|nr:LysR family transcriptional regulator [Salinisphaera sp.]
MNLHHLMIFLAIAETGSITAASERLHISQPALSRELKSFEERLQVCLFERHARGMHLTEPGLLLADYARRLFTLEAEASAAMEAVASARRGRFAIGASNTVGTYVLPPILARFRRQRPEVQISLFVGNTEQVAEGVADMRFLLGFIEGPLHTPDLSTQTFREDGILPVVAADHELAERKRIRITDLAEQPLLLREAGSGTRELIDRLILAHDLGQAPVMELGNTEALKQAAIHGGGIAWLPRISMVDELGRGALVPLGLASLHIQRELAIVRRTSAYLPPAAQALIAALTGKTPAD